MSTNMSFNFNNTLLSLFSISGCKKAPATSNELTDDEIEDIKIKEEDISEDVELESEDIELESDEKNIIFDHNDRPIRSTRGQRYFI